VVRAPGGRAEVRVRAVLHDRLRGGLSEQERGLRDRGGSEHCRPRPGQGQDPHHHHRTERYLRVHLRPEGAHGGARAPGLEDQPHGKVTSPPSPSCPPGRDIGSIARRRTAPPATGRREEERMKNPPSTATTKWAQTGSESARLFADAQAVLPGGNTRTTVYMAPYPPYADSGDG